MYEVYFNEKIQILECPLDYIPFHFSFMTLILLAPILLMSGMVAWSNLHLALEEQRNYISPAGAL